MKRFFGLACFTLLLVSIIPKLVFADGRYYVTTLFINPDEVFNGSTRDYDYNNYSISIRTDEIVGANPGQTKTNLVTALYKKGWFSNTRKARVTLDMQLDTTTTAQMGNHGTGKFYYSFGSFERACMDDYGGHGVRYLGVSSDYVVLNNYS